MVIVVVLFLQSWRASVIPLVAIPVSLIGTFAVLQAFGFSLNTLSLFGLVLAIGIVVDDAIVVVEDVERNLDEGMTPRDAAHRTMDEVGGALVAIALVLSAVFVPTAFIPGISGQFYRQFALTIASATLISCLVSLTLSPALAALLLRPRSQARRSRIGRILGRFFDRFNAGFDRLSNLYGKGVGKIVRVSALVLVAYAGLLVLTGVQFWRAPGGFIPAQDQGYFITIVQLPPGSSLSRTDAVVQRAIKELRAIPGVAHTAAFSGFDAATSTNASNAAAVFFTVTPFAERAAHGVDGAVVLRTARQRMAAIAEANIFVIAPPSVRGLSTTGGFKFIVQDQGARGLRALRDAAGQITAAAAREPGLTAVFSQFEVSTPQIYVDIDRDRAQAHGVPPARVFEALEIFLGSSFVNDFNYLGRTYRVTAQADSQFRRTARNVSELRTRSDTGGMVPLGSVATFRDVSGPTRVTRYNLYPAVEVLGDMTPGTSFGQGMSTMEALAKSSLPEGFSYEWTELAFQQQQAGNTAAYVFAFAVDRRLSRAGRTVRERDVAARGRADRADVPPGGDHRRAAARTGQQHPHADRSRRARRARVQERHPDRRVREASGGSAQARSVCRGRTRGPSPAAADSHDVVRIHSRCGATGRRHRCRRRSTPGTRDRRLRRDAWCHAVRPAADASRFTSSAAVCRSGASQ